MPRLSDNNDLYNYLRSLAELLESRSQGELAEHLMFAARQGTGLITEFLGESLIALKKVYHSQNGLRADEKEDLKQAISQVEFVMKR